MKHIILALAVSLSFGAAADQAIIDNINKASDHFNLSELTQIEKSSTGYDQAYANYRLGLANMTQQKMPEAGAYFVQASTALETQLQAFPEDVESMALLASIYGLRISTEAANATVLGPKSYELLVKANEISPNNPRLQLIQGIIKYNTPAMYGGNKTIAFNYFENAIKHYPADLNSGFYWGHEEAYVWRGLAKVEQGNTQAAVSDFKQALAINPSYTWAKILIDQNNK